MKLSIVIPVYNEETRLRDSLDKILKFCDYHYKNDYEVIVVDDGSTDRTRSVVKKYNVQLTKRRENMGKGYSVKQGVLIARGEYILYTDSDLSTPIEELKKFMKLIIKNDIVIASRAKPDSNVKTRMHKKLLGRFSNLIISRLVVSGIDDTQCGFKLFKRDVAKKVFAKQTIYQWGFDFEILFLAKKYNYKIYEQGITWIENNESKVKLSDYPKTLSDLLKIRVNSFRGVYDEK